MLSNEVRHRGSTPCGEQEVSAGIGRIRYERTLRPTDVPEGHWLAQLGRQQQINLAVYSFLVQQLLM